jgi:hypothetical protein
MRLGGLKYGSMYLPTKGFLKKYCTCCPVLRKHRQGPLICTCFVASVIAGVRKESSTRCQLWLPHMPGPALLCCVWHVCLSVQMVSLG